MTNFNPLHQFLRSRHPSPAEGQGGGVHPSDLPGADLDFLIRAAEAAGHLTYKGRTGMGPFRYWLTADGAEFLSGS